MGDQAALQTTLTPHSKDHGQANQIHPFKKWIPEIQSLSHQQREVLEHVQRKGTQLSLLF